MPALLSAGAMALAAGASLASGLINTGVNIWSQKDQQQFNAEEALKQREFSSAEAQKQRDFEERMSNTAYQRARADLEAAGYNPASIGMSGAASTPTSSIPSGYAAQSASHNVGALNNQAIGSLMSSAIAQSMRDNKSFRTDVYTNMRSTSAKEVSRTIRDIEKMFDSPNGGFNVL